MNPNDPYTHEFKFEVDNSFIYGEVEFNTDGKVSFKIENTSIPLPKEILNEFVKLMEMVQSIYKTEGEVKKIVIKKRVV